LVVLRVFFGVVYLLNGLAKISPLHNLTIGPWKSFLINFDESRNILSHDIKSSIGIYHDAAANIVLPNYSTVGYLLAAAEIIIGIGLITGFWGRLAAMGGALLAANVQLAAIGGGEWTFEYLVELVPLIVLALTPTPALGDIGRWTSARARRG